MVVVRCLVQSVFVGIKPRVPLQGKIPTIKGLVRWWALPAMRGEITCLLGLAVVTYDSTERKISKNSLISELEMHFLCKLSFLRNANKLVDFDLKILSIVYLILTLIVNVYRTQVGNVIIVHMEINIEMWIMWVILR